MSITASHPVLDFVHTTTRHWWWLLVAGIAWIVLAVVILRFNVATVATVAVLFGAYCLLAAANEVATGAIASMGWRVVHWLLAALFTVVAVLAFQQPGATFISLAAVIASSLVRTVGKPPTSSNARFDHAAKEFEQKKLKAPRLGMQS